MKHISIIIFSTGIILSNVAWANPINQPSTNSLSEAALEINAKNAPSQTNAEAAKPYTNESEKNNSLSRGALALQQAHTKSHSNDKPSHSASFQQSSFYGAVLEKQFSPYK
tara:strand:- start:654 stop:986 length:333 start_codon:yes stop_codon:yes gene_type:complete